MKLKNIIILIIIHKVYKIYLMDFDKKNYIYQILIYSKICLYIFKKKKKKKLYIIYKNKKKKKI